MLRFTTIVALSLFAGAACSVGIGDEDEQDTVNRAGVRVFNAMVGAPAIGVRVAGDINVPDAEPFNTFDATQYVGVDAGGAVIRLYAAGSSTQSYAFTIGNGTGVERLAPRDRWLAVLAGDYSTGPRALHFRERRNDGTFTAGVDATTPSSTQTYLSVINATMDAQPVTLDVGDWNVTLEADQQDFRLVAAATALVTTATSGTSTIVSELPALPAAADASLVVTGSVASGLRLVYLPSPLGATASAPVELSANPSVTLVNAIGRAVSVRTTADATALALAANGTLAGIAATSSFAPEVGEADQTAFAAIAPVALDSATSYLIVLTEDDAGISAIAYADVTGVNTLRAYNFVVDAGATDVALTPGVSLGSDLVYSAAGNVAAVTLDTITGMTATTSAETYTFGVSADVLNPKATDDTGASTEQPALQGRHLVLVGDVASAVSVVVVRANGSSVVVGAE